jgi:hypothetical protein
MLGDLEQLRRPLSDEQSMWCDRTAQRKANSTRDRPHRGIDKARTTQGPEDARAIDPREAQRDVRSVWNVVASQAPGTTGHGADPQNFPIPDGRAATSGRVSLTQRVSGSSGNCAQGRAGARKHISASPRERAVEASQLCAGNAAVCALAERRQAERRAAVSGYVGKPTEPTRSGIPELVPKSAMGTQAHQRISAPTSCAASPPLRRDAAGRVLAT